MTIDNMAIDGYVIARNAELAAWTELIVDTPAPLRTRLGLSVSFIGSAVVLSAAAIDHPLLNRAFVSSTDADAEVLASIVGHYQSLGIGRFLIHRRQDDGYQAAAAQKAGLSVYRRRWVKLLARARPPVSADLAIQVELATPEDAAACGELYCSGFNVPVDAAGVFANAVGHPEWRAVVARYPDRRVAGLGMLFMRNGVGYLGGGVTAPDYRGRGVQRALLAARISMAVESGCRWICSETGEDTPGDPQHSLHNLQRFGLEIVGVTENLAAAEMTWDHGMSRANPGAA